MQVFWIFFFALLVVMPALLVALVPRRWLLRVLLLWPFLPIPIYIVLGGGLMLLLGQTRLTLHEFVELFFDYGSILLPAWVPTWLVGFILGAIVRRLRRRGPSTVLVTAAPPAI